MSYLPVHSLPRHCLVMYRRVLTPQPISTGCTVGQQADTWPRATTTGRRRARLCPTQAAGWACTQEKSTPRWPLNTRPEKVQDRHIIIIIIIITCNFFIKCCCWVFVLFFTFWNVFSWWPHKATRFSPCLSLVTHPHFAISNDRNRCKHPIPEKV